ncbi:hypothetical protein PSEUDO8Z_160526 [Pseudomonas sp. 8Z]|nr:hypothetical protein PSEUDO8Z_160526 [Pseudomonas sp. 8Z]
MAAPLEGPWMALASRSRSDAGVREVERSETRMAGVRFFCLLFFVLGGNPSSKKSESPEGAKPGISEHVVAASRTPTQASTQTCQSGIKQAAPYKNGEP